MTAHVGAWLSHLIYVPKQVAINQPAYRTRVNRSVAPVFYDPLCMRLFS